MLFSINNHVTTQSVSGVKKTKADIHKLGHSYPNLAKLFVAVIRKPRFFLQIV